MVLPLLIGAALLLITLLSYAIAINLIVAVVARLIRAGYTAPGFWKNLAVIALVSQITAAAHLTQIALWAAVFLACGAISGFEKAFYFSAQNCTALGYGDVLLPDRWRLLGPLEAINGLLFFGMSTALLFAITSNLIANRLHAELSRRHDAGAKHAPLTAAGATRWLETEDLLSERYSLSTRN